MRAVEDLMNIVTLNAIYDNKAMLCYEAKKTKENHSLDNFLSKRHLEQLTNRYADRVIAREEEEEEEALMDHKDRHESKRRRSQ
jgi:hypothetical protein